jgi:hypothetical protein
MYFSPFSRKEPQSSVRPLLPALSSLYGDQHSVVQWQEKPYRACQFDERMGGIGSRPFGVLVEIRDDLEHLAVSSERCLFLVAKSAICD